MFEFIIRNGICIQLRFINLIFYFKGYKNFDRNKFLRGLEYIIFYVVCFMILIEIIYFFESSYFLCSEGFVKKVWQVNKG